MKMICEDPQNVQLGGYEIVYIRLDEAVICLRGQPDNMYLVFLDAIVGGRVAAPILKDYPEFALT